jgi:hypothetical protein
LEAAFILLEFPSPSRRIFIGSHSLPPLSGSPYRSFRLFGSHGGGVAVRRDAVGHDDTVDEELGSWKRKACGGLASLAAAAKNSWRRGNGRRGCRASLVEGLGVS